MWFRLTRFLRICWIVFGIALSPLQRRWPYCPDHIRALVIVRDLYSPLPDLIAQLRKQGILAKHILLLDSGSTNPNCLSTLFDLELMGCRWIRLSDDEELFGPYAPWLSHRLRSMIKSWSYPYLVTDPDLAIPPDIPTDWLANMFSLLNNNRSVFKVGLPLSLRGLTIENSNAIKAHEISLYQSLPYRILSYFLLGTKTKARLCPTDTTLALYRPGTIFSTFSIRLSSRYSIAHLPWLASFRSTPEFQYYQRNKLSIYGEWS
jgi:hypothetical protein